MLFDWRRKTCRRAGNYRTAEDFLRAYEKRAGSRDEIAREQKLIQIQQGHLGGAEALFASTEARSDKSATKLLLEAYIEGNLKIIVNTARRELKLKDKLEIAEIERTQGLVDRWFELSPNRFDQAQGNFWRGYLHSFARDFSQAKEAFREALRLNENHLEARRMLAGFLQFESPEEAMIHYEKLLERQPDNIAFKFDLARTQRTLGKLQEAKLNLDELLAKNPLNVTLLLEQGHLAMDLGQLDEAERWFKQALTQEPENGDARLALSQCLQMAGRTSEAKKYLELYKKATKETEKH